MFFIEYFKEVVPFLYQAAKCAFYFFVDKTILIIYDAQIISVDVDLILGAVPYFVFRCDHDGEMFRLSDRFFMKKNKHILLIDGGENSLDRMPKTFSLRFLVEMIG